MHGYNYDNIIMTLHDIKLHDIIHIFILSSSQKNIIISFLSEINKLTCGNLCSLLASSLSQFNSSMLSVGPGLLQPHISSSKAQSPALEEAT